jgi:lipase chaperone LimK
MIILAVAAGGMWVRGGGVQESSADKRETVSVREARNPVTGDSHYTFSIPTDPGEPMGSGDLWKALRDVLEVERIAPNEDPQQRARDIARRDFRELNQVVRELRQQGLEAGALYAAVEDRLSEANDEGALEMLDGYRRLEEGLAAVDLDAMVPEERFEIVVKARRDAFGEEMAENLFFEQEAYTQYKLEEEAILKDKGLTEAEKQAEITGRRNALQVDLASRGSYVSFGDERGGALDQKLRESYGEGVTAMSEEQRRAAILALYREELLPEMLSRVEQVLAGQEARRGEFEAARGEREAILNDPDLSFEEKQERLVELSAP